MYRYAKRVRLSACLSHRSTAACRCGVFAAAGAAAELPAAEDISIDGGACRARSTAFSSRCEQSAALPCTLAAGVGS